MTFVPLHHARKGTRLSPSLLFVVVVRGESLGTRLYIMSTASFQKIFCGFSLGVANYNRLSLLPPTVNTNQLHRPSKVSYCVRWEGGQCVCVE